MKRYAYLLAGLLAAAATPALASEAAPAPSAPTLVQSQLDSRASSDQTRQALARLREALEARKQALKDAATHPQHEANGLCSDCPEKDAAGHRHSVSEERKVDCIECVDRPHYA